MLGAHPTKLAALLTGIGSVYGLLYGTYACVFGVWTRPFCESMTAVDHSMQPVVGISGTSARLVSVLQHASDLNRESAACGTPNGVWFGWNFVTRTLLKAGRFARSTGTGESEREQALRCRIYLDIQSLDVARLQELPSVAGGCSSAECGAFWR